MTAYAWLIGGWTTDANEARRFATRAEAEKFIRDKTPGNMRAVEHGWLSSGVSA